MEEMNKQIPQTKRKKARITLRCCCPSIFARSGMRVLTSRRSVEQVESGLVANLAVLNRRSIRFAGVDMFRLAINDCRKGPQLWRKTGVSGHGEEEKI